MPTRLFADAGERIDWPVSLPVPISGEVRRDRRAGAAARTAGRAREVVGVEHLAAEAADRHAAARELLQVRLAPGSARRPCASSPP